MAEETISVKIGLDTTQFNQSLRGLQNELKALSKVDITILSPEQGKAVVSRMGDIKDQITMMKKEMIAADPGNFFNSFTTLSSPVIASLSALSLGMSSFGMESKKVEEIQRKMMAVIGILSALQTISDANKLKGIAKQIPLQYLELKNRLTNLLLIKQETVAVIAGAGAQEVMAGGVKKLTILQTIWNKAVLANPILLIAAGIIALVAAIAILGKAMTKNKQENVEQYRTVDGLIIKDEELRKTHNESIDTLKELTIDYQLLTGAITETEASMQRLDIQTGAAMRKMKEDMAKELKDAEDKVRGFGNTIKNIAKTKWLGMLLWGTDEERADRKRLKEEEMKVVAERVETYKKAGLSLKEIFAAEQKFVDDNNMKSTIGNKRFFTWQIQNTNDFNKAKTQIEAKYATIQQEIQANANQAGLTLLESDRRKIIAMTKSLNEGLIADEKEKAASIRESRLDELNSSVVFLERFSLDRAIAARAEEIYLDASIAIWQTYDKTIYDIEKSRAKKEQDFLDGLIKATKDAKNKLDDINNPKTELDILERTYIDAVAALDKRHKDEKSLDSEYNKQRQELDAAYAANQQTIILEKATETNKKLLDFQEQYLKKSMKATRDAEIDKVVKTGKEAGASPEDIAKARYVIEKKYTDLIRDYKNESNNKELDAEIAALDQSLLNEEEYQKARQEILEKYDKLEQQKQDEKQTKQDLYVQAATGALQIIADQQQAAYDNEMRRTQDLYDEKIKKIDDQLKYGQLSQEEADARKADLDKKRAEKEKQLRIQKAKADKALALFDIAINTAVAVSKASPVIPLMVMAGIAGAIEAAIVLARPIPQYAKGTKYAEGGLSIVGEKGIELMNVPRGAQITPNNELKNMLGGISYQDAVGLIQEGINSYHYTNKVVLKTTELDREQTYSKNIKLNSEVQ